MDLGKVRLTRRSVLEAALGAASASLAGCIKEIPEPAEDVGIIGPEGERVLPWSNWSGNLSCQPSRRLVPRDEDELREIIRTSRQRIRFVGAGHSFSPLVPTLETLVTLAALRGVESVDAQTGEALILGGTRLAQIGEPLWERSRALCNQPDIDAQSLAGAIATSTHGTGATLGSMSSDVTRLALIAASGDVIECSRDRDAEVFHAARTSFGALGAVSKVAIRTREAYKLHERSWMMPLEEGLGQAEKLRDSHRHFEMYGLPHADFILCITLDETATEDFERIADESGESTLRTVAKLTSALPFLRSTIINAAASRVESQERAGRSYRIFGNLRTTRFNEMEYTVPAEKGPACLRAILDKIKRDNIDVIFPIEYRYVQADDIWLSPFFERDGCSISCHNFHDHDYKRYFAAIEPIFWSFEGRPHPGKIHTLQARHFERLYPRWSDFLRVRRELDPHGKFLNDHLTRLFGV